MAATKSFTSQIVVLLLVAIWMSHKKGLLNPAGDVKNKNLRTSLINSLRQLPLAMGQTINDCQEQC